MIFRCTSDTYDVSSVRKGIRNKRVLNWYVISILLYSSEFWTISSQRRKQKYGSTGRCWTEHASNVEVLRKMEKNTIIHKIRI